MPIRPQGPSLEPDAPVLVLFVDRDHARLVLREDGATRRLDDWTFAPDTASWRLKEGRPPTSTRGTGQSVGRTRGAHRDLFDARLATHRRKFWRQAAIAAGKALIATRAAILVVAGSAEARRALPELLSVSMRKRLAGTFASPSYTTDAALVRTAVPIAAKALRARAAGPR